MTTGIRIGGYLAFLCVLAIPTGFVPQASAGQPMRLDLLCRNDVPAEEKPTQITLADAMEQCTKMIQQRGIETETLAQAYNNRCWLRHELGDDDESALRDCTLAIGYQPRMAAAFVNRGRIAAALGKAEQAKRDYDEAIRLDQKIAAAWSGRGAALVQLGKWQDAINDADYAIELDRNLAAAYNVRGAVYEAVGAYAKAKAEFDKALDLDPKCAEALLNRGIVSLRQGDVMEAIRDFNRSIRYRDFYARAFLMRGFAYEVSGRSDLARIDYKRAHAAGLTSAWLAEKLSE